MIDVADLLEPSASVRPRLTAGIRIGEDIGSGLPLSRRRGELEMALLNLVSNAVDAMPSGGDLRVGASAMDDGPRSSSPTRDRASAHLLPRIFEPWVTSKQVAAPGLMSASRAT